MSTDALGALVLRFHEARAAGDLEGAPCVFHADAEFRLNGEAAGCPHIAEPAQGGPALRETFTTFQALFRMHNGRSTRGPSRETRRR
jgi:hypothetical protein